MSDDNQQTPFDFLKDLSFAPGWAKNPPQEQTLSQFSGDDHREERGGRHEREAGGRNTFRRDERREERGPRRENEGGKPRTNFRRDDRGEGRRDERGPRRDAEGAPRPAFRSSDKGLRRPAAEEKDERVERTERVERPVHARGGERGERNDRGGERGRRGPRDTRPDLASLPVEVRFLPDQKEMGVVIRKVQAGHRAYPVRELARLFLEHPASCTVRLEVKSSQPEMFLHQCGRCGFVSTDAEALRAHMLEKHFDEDFEKSTIEGEAPSGEFSCVAKCGISGRLIGPPNHHSFAQRMRDVLHEVAPGMSEETYRHKLEMIHDKDVIQQWKDEARIQTVYRRKKPLVDEKAPAAVEAKAAEAAAAETSPLEVAPVEAPAEVEAPVAAVEPEEEPALDRAMAEAVFEHDIVPKCTTNRKRVSCTFDQAQAVRDAFIAPAVREVWRIEQRSAGSLFIALRGAFRAKKFHLFRANDDRGMEFVIPKMPVALDASNAVPELAQVLDYVRDHKGCTRTDLFAALGVPQEGTRTEEQTKIFQQYTWIVEGAHLIEYHNGVLALPDVHPYFRQLPKPRAVAPEAEAPVAAAAEAAAETAVEEVAAEPVQEAVVEAVAESAPEAPAAEEAPVAAEPVAEAAPVEEAAPEAAPEATNE